MDENVLYDYGELVVLDMLNSFGRFDRVGIKNCVERLQSKDDAIETETFEVGFYSSYLVADKVSVQSKRYGCDQYIWKAAPNPPKCHGFAVNRFTLKKDVEGKRLDQGTEITLFLKEDQLKYLEEKRIKDLLKKNFEHVRHPIYLWTEKIKDDKVVSKWQRINSAEEPIWILKPEHITKKKYKIFLDSLSINDLDYLSVGHFFKTGGFQFQGIMFVPKSDSVVTNDGKIKLYVKRVLIRNSYRELLPEYLQFMVGVIDIDMGSVNFSLRLYEQNRSFVTVRKFLVEKCLDMFNDIAINKDDYNIFYTSYSKFLKQGILEDSENAEILASLLRFQSTESDALTSLREYITRMKEGQKLIYYVKHENRREVENSTFLERFKDKGYEVLLLVDDTEEFAVCDVKKSHGMGTFSVTLKWLKLLVQGENQ